MSYMVSFKERFGPAWMFDIEGAAMRLRLLGRFNVSVDDSLWSRLSVEARAEVDGLIADGRHVQAIAVMRERAGLPQSDLRECVDPLELRASSLRR
ncbi:hypothetical protein OHA27_09535 [Streptomyces sp. NBC_01619]|uniref:Uncharacterized protein n=1 Tax=Streptomyces pratisoli TaxID=3139917 RepID=A0ACC6QBH4_9ACTN|nr:hypothetical protein [Streptomyces sp. NBC_01619]MCX4510545.1 hypothetical protein [Streptomyces sp. NBC_01619]